MANFRALRDKFRELVAPKNGQKYFLSTDPFFDSTVVSESIEQISELYGLN